MEPRLLDSGGVLENMTTDSLTFPPEDGAKCPSLSGRGESLPTNRIRQK